MGCICAVAVGAAFPLNIFIFKGVVNEFTGGNVVIAENVYGSVKWFAVLGAAMFLVSFIQDFCMNISASRQINRIRLLYFKVCHFTFYLVNLYVITSLIFGFQTNLHIDKNVQFLMSISHSLLGLIVRTRKKRNLLHF